MNHLEILLVFKCYVLRVDSDLRVDYYGANDSEKDMPKVYIRGHFTGRNQLILLLCNIIVVFCESDYDIEV